MGLVDYVCEAVDSLGGVGERGDGDWAQLLLPPELAGALSLPEDVRITEGSGEASEDGPEGVSVFYGSPLLESLMAAAVGSGRAAAVRVDLPAPSPSTAEAAAQRLLRPRNGVVRLVGAAPTRATYLILGYQYLASGEERREGLVDVALDVSGRLASPTLPGALHDGVVPFVEEPADVVVSLLPQLARVAGRLAQASAREALAPVRQVLSHRLERGVARMHGYYRDMQQELLQRGARRSLDAEAEEQLIRRINAIPHELSQRVAELQARLALRVTLRPVTAVALTMPAVEVRLRVFRRKTERELSLLYGALQRACDVPVCEGCGAVTVATPTLCDHHAHLVCSACSAACPSCGARCCLACHRRCRRCGGPLQAQARRRGESTKAAASQPTPQPAPQPTPQVEPAAPTPARPSRPPLPGAASSSGQAAGRAQAPQSPAFRTTVGPQDGPELGRSEPPSTRAHVRAQEALAEILLELGEGHDGQPAVQQVQQALLQLGEADARTIATRSDVPLKIVRQALAELRQRGQVIRTGVGRGTRYHCAPGIAERGMAGSGRAN